MCSPYRGEPRKHQTFWTRRWTIFSHPRYSYCICIICLYLIIVFFAGRGIYILYEDVKSCPYEDVHVLWSILVESHTHTLPSLPAPKAWRLYMTDSQLPRIYTVFIHIKLYFYTRVQCKKVFPYFFWFLIYL